DSIDDAHECQPYRGDTAWTGRALNVTVKYPSPDFVADPNPEAVSNQAVATANLWGQPEQLLSSEDAVSHGLREGTPGASVGKRPGYDWSIGAPLYRGTP